MAAETSKVGISGRDRLLMVLCIDGSLSIFMYVRKNFFGLDLFHTIGCNICAAAVLC